MLENRFKANAANCLLLSDQVTYPLIRAGLLDIAHAWLELAEQANVEQSYYLSESMISGGTERRHRDHRSASWSRRDCRSGSGRALLPSVACWSPILVLPALLVKLLLRVVADCRDLASCS